MKRLPRLPPNFASLPNRDELLQRYWQELVQTLEQVPAIQEALAAVDAAVIEAQAAAEAANAAAEAAGSQNSIGDSWPIDLTLEAFNDGTDCHVEISDHVRHYGDGAEVDVDGDILSGIPHDTIVRVYYDQSDRSGGAVSYGWTSDATEAAQVGDRHSVGAVVTPRASEVDSIRGAGANPPGFALP